MRRFVLALMLGCTALGSVVLLAADELPLWAYGYHAAPPPLGTPAPAPAPPPKAAAPAKSRGRCPARLARLHGHRFPTCTILRTGFRTPTRRRLRSSRRVGKARKILACAVCHLHHGRGRPQNAPVSGLPVLYFIQTMRDFRNGTRKSADPRKDPTN